MIKRLSLDNILELSIWGIVFCLPFSKSLSEGFIISAIIMTVLRKIKFKEFNIPKSPLTLALVLYFVINLLSVFWSVNFSLSLKALFSKVLKYILLFLIMYDFIDSKDKLKRLLIVIASSIFLITINGLIQQFITGYDLLRRYPSFKYVTYSALKFPTYLKMAFQLPPEQRGYVTSSFPYPNDYATWLITLLPLAITLSVFGLKEAGLRIRVLGYSAMSLLTYSLFLTKTRGAWVAFSIGIICLSILRSKKLIIAFVIVAAIFYIFMPLHVKEAVTSKLSFKDRISMWSVSTEMIKDRPLRGFGLNTYFNNFKIYRKDKDKYKRGSYAHNCYLQQAADVGIPGLAIFLYLLFSIFWYSFHRMIKMKDKFYLNCCIGIWVGLLSFSVYAFVDTNFYSLPLVTLFWFMTGLLFSIGNIYEKSV